MRGKDEDDDGTDNHSEQDVDKDGSSNHDRGLPPRLLIGPLELVIGKVGVCIAEEDQEQDESTSKVNRGARAVGQARATDMKAKQAH